VGDARTEVESAGRRRRRASEELEKERIFWDVCREKTSESNRKRRVRVRDVGCGCWYQRGTDFAGPESEPKGTGAREEG
jgi:hypothetical protein